MQERMSAMPWRRGVDCTPIGGHGIIRASDAGSRRMSIGMLRRRAAIPSILKMRHNAFWLTPSAFHCGSNTTARRLFAGNQRALTQLFSI